MYKEFDSDIRTLHEATKPPRMIHEDGKQKRAFPEIPAERIALAKRRLENLNGLAVIEALIERAQRGYRLDLGL